MGVFWKRRERSCRVARQWVEAKRVGVWRNCALWRSLAINGVDKGACGTGSRVCNLCLRPCEVKRYARGYLLDIVGRAHELCGRRRGQGGEKRVVGFSLVVSRGTVQGTGGLGFWSERERRGRGTRR